MTRASAASRSSPDSLPRTTPLVSDACTRSRSRADLSAARATATTSYPARANTSTIPAAIVPDPTTPTVRMLAPLPWGTAAGVCASSTTFGEPGFS